MFGIILRSACHHRDSRPASLLNPIRIGGIREGTRAFRAEMREDSRNRLTRIEERLEYR
jgi:hypothetical protein